MTINIALATYDGIILGCDSLSSITERALFPLRPDCEWARDEDGNLLLDRNGNPMIPATPQNLTLSATTVFGGVSKMFCLYTDPDTTVAALTAGMATLSDITIAEQAKRFKRRNEVNEKKYVSSLDVANDFTAFAHEMWLKQFEDTPEDRRAFLPNLYFVIAGFGADDEYGKVFKSEAKDGTVHEQFPDGDHMGLCWEGTADYVERLIHGIDTQIRVTATRVMAEAIAKQREITVADLSKALVGAGVNLPEDLKLEVTEHAPSTLPWDNARADIGYGNLSTQYAVDLVEMLVNTQSGMQRFAHGIPTVGGRTHIGVLKRGEGFRLLNGPELVHRHTGYGHDF